MFVVMLTTYVDEWAYSEPKCVCRAAETARKKCFDIAEEVIQSKRGAKEHHISEKIEKIFSEDLKTTKNRWYLAIRPPREIRYGERTYDVHYEEVDVID